MYLFSIENKITIVGLGTEEELSGVGHTLRWVERVEEMLKECALDLY